MCDKTNQTGKDPAISDFGLVAWIDAAERQGGTVYLMQLYNAALAHPWRLTQMIEQLVDCKMIAIAPDGSAALNALRPALTDTRHLEGPLLKQATPELVRSLASRGVQMKVGDDYTDAGMAVIAFNRAAGSILRQPANLKFMHTTVTLTDVGREVLKARGLGGEVAAPKPRPFGG